MKQLQFIVSTLTIILSMSLMTITAENSLAETLEQAMSDNALEHELKHANPKYVCPMHPQIIRDEQGTCPICGMDLVKKIIKKEKDKYPTVEVSHAVVQNMGIRTKTAVKDTLWKYIKTIGQVDYDDSRLVHMHPKVSGWMEKLHFKVEGEPVKKGQLLGELYSPEVLSAQLDYLVASKETGKFRQENAKNRLRLLGMTEWSINQINKNKKSSHLIPIHAPNDGIMAKLTARQGMYIKPEMEIFTIADLSQVWVLVDIFEHQIDWIKTGLSAEMTVPAYPGKKWEGEIKFIYPSLDPKSRTLKVRLVFDNPDLLLKANMFAEIVIYGGPKRNVLVIPEEALIETGKRTVVVKKAGQGLFKPVDVLVGMRRNGRVEILNGLKAGDEVVVSGQFLIDSESSLQASFMRMAEGE